MNEFLPVRRISLVRVVDYQLTGVVKEEGLPDWGQAVVGDCAAAGGDVGDEAPGVAVVVGGVEVDFGVVEG